MANRALETSGWRSLGQVRVCSLARSIRPFFLCNNLLSPSLPAPLFFPFPCCSALFFPSCPSCSFTLCTLVMLYFEGWMAVHRLRVFADKVLLSCLCEEFKVQICNLGGCFVVSMSLSVGQGNLAHGGFRGNTRGFLL